MIHVSIFWHDKDEPLKTHCESVLSEGGFLCVELTHDLLPPGVDHKTILFPNHRIHSVEILEYPEDKMPEGYRENSTFREQPDKSRWFRGMGQSNGGGQDSDQG